MTANEVLQRFGNNIWTVDGADVRMFGIPFSTRMTIVRLNSGGLWVHSPVELDAAGFADIDALGPVEHVVAPNKIHSIGIVPWKKRYPSAVVWVSPGFAERHEDIPFDAALGGGNPHWQNEIDEHVFLGSSWFDEVVFLHRASKTLIVTDLIQKHEPDAQSWFWRRVKRYVGVLGVDGGTAKDLRATFRDKAAARRSREHVLAWDFDNLIVSHGLCVQGSARSSVSRALSWLGTTPQSIES